MNLTNLTDFDKWYFEILSKNEIRINATTNNYNTLFFDENLNKISQSTVGAGRQDIVKMTANTNGNIILWNLETDSVQFLESTFDEDEEENYFLIDMQKTNKYYINATKYNVSQINNNTISVNLTGKGIFKVIVNGIEIKEYTYAPGGLTITGDDIANVSENQNSATIYCYEIDQSISGETIFEYYSPIKIFSTDIEDYNDLSFFTNMYEVCLFDEFSVTHTRTFNSTNRAYRYNQKQREINREIQINMTHKTELRDITKDFYFRFLGWSGGKKELHIFNNCLIQQGANLQYQKLNPNTFTYTITCEDYIKLDYNTQTVYGTSPYGAEPYGGNYFTNYVYLQGGII